MSAAPWDDEAGYANGADGSCQNCGAETDEPYHLFCPPCYRKEQGWDEPADDGLEEELDRIDGVLPFREECPECGETRVLFPRPADGERVCLDCKEAHR